MLKYKGYIGKASYDSGSHMIEGRITNAAIGTFTVNNIQEIEKEFRKTIDVYLKVCKENNIKPMEPHKGQLSSSSSYVDF